MISAFNLFPMLIKSLSFISVIITNLFFNEEIGDRAFKFVIVSRVYPDFEITTKHEFFRSAIFLNLECRFESRLSKKK